MNTPPDRRTLAQAAEWFVLLASGEASDEDRCRWHGWLNAHPSHRLAWQRAEASVARLSGLPAAQAQAAAQALRQPPARRRFVGQLAALLTLGGTGWLGYRHSDHSADLRTAVGEQRETRLADGSRLQLDTDSTVDLDFSAKTRLIRLRRGQILIETATDELARPFIVETAEGRIRALGTRFTVEQLAGQTRVAVLDQRVAIHAAASSDAPILGAGEAARFDRDGIRLRQTVDDIDRSWHRGLLVANAMRLAEFTARLGRYRTTPLHCADDIAELRISGVFPLADDERALATLTGALPVTLVRGADGDRLQARK